MKRLSRLALSLAIASLIAAGPGRAAAPAPAPTSVSTPPAVSPSVQNRIDALLKRRLRPEPLPINLPNPFQMSVNGIRDGMTDSATKTESDAVAVKPAGVGDNLEVLTAIAGRLKVGGVIVLKDQLQVVVNGVPRREGDLIAGDSSGGVVYVKVARLAPGQIVLRYGDAEVTVKF